MKSLDQEEWTLPERSIFTLDGAALPDALVLHLYDMNNFTFCGRQGSAVFMRTLRHHRRKSVKPFQKADHRRTDLR